MTRAKHNLPRTLRTPPSATGRAGFKEWLHPAAVALTGAAILAVTVIALQLGGTGGRRISEQSVDRDIAGLLGGIPQTGSTLGSPTAPVTLQVFLDLKDPDSRNWFLKDLPGIVGSYVRPGTVKLEYHAYKTNTFSPAEFVRDQTAALAAGAQNKLWNYLYTFYTQARRAKEASEFEDYATDSFLLGVAHQVPGLNIGLWQTDRHTGRREEQTTSEDALARTLGLHVTPSFRIGPSHGPFHNYSGHAIVKYGAQHPIAFPEASDIGEAIKELTKH